MPDDPFWVSTAIYDHTFPYTPLLCNTIQEVYITMSKGEQDASRCRNDHPMAQGYKPTSRTQQRHLGACL